MIRKFKERLESTIQGEKQLKKQRTELQNQLEELEERYVMKGLEKVLYEKYASKLNTEISKIDDELTNKSFRSSNLEIAVEKCLTIAEKLSQFWVLGNYVIKQKLQYLLFPEGILYDKENDTVRTPKTSLILAGISQQARVSAEMKKGNSEKNCLESHLVGL
ncbi:MAG: hypothetical protein IPI78_00870 [Chitinophagaceae bacterium]|nr:hypothetical protein [Chitinophagaceae bacterium]